MRNNWQRPPRRSPCKPFKAKNTTPHRLVPRFDLKDRNAHGEAKEVGQLKQILHFPDGSSSGEAINVLLTDATKTHHLYRFDHGIYQQSLPPAERPANLSLRGDTKEVTEAFFERVPALVDHPISEPIRSQGSDFKSNYWSRAERGDKGIISVFLNRFYDVEKKDGSILLMAHLILPAVANARAFNHYDLHLFKLDEEQKAGFQVFLQSKPLGHSPAPRLSESETSHYLVFKLRHQSQMSNPGLINALAIYLHTPALHLLPPI